MLDEPPAFDQFCPPFREHVVPMRFPLRIKLLAAICLPLLAVYLTVLSVEFYAGKRHAEREVKEGVGAEAKARALALDRELSKVAQVADGAAQFLLAFPARDVAGLETRLQAMLESNDRIFGCAIALVPGVLGPQSPACAPYLCRTAAGEFRHVDIAQSVPNYTRLDWYLLPKLLGKATWTDPYFDEGAGNVLMCTYAVPLLRDNEFLGVVAVDIALDHLRHDLTKSPPDYEGGYYMLLSRNGTFISHPNEKFILAQSISSLAEEYGLPELQRLTRRVVTERPEVEALPDYEGRGRVWIVSTLVPSTGWVLAARIFESTAMQEAHARMWRNLTVFVAGFALMIFCVLLVTGWITRPLERLAAVAHQVAGGDLTAQVTNVGSHDEIGQFTATFNQMVRDLKENVETTILATAAREGDGEGTAGRPADPDVAPAERAASLPRSARVYAGRRE